jgi:hypothetical protein
VSAEPVAQGDEATARLLDDLPGFVFTAVDNAYERGSARDFAWGRPDAERGMRQIIVGTGGAELRGFPVNDPNSEVRDGSTYGVLRLDLHPGAYDRTFLSVQGGSFNDSGSGTCH